MTPVLKMLEVKHHMIMQSDVVQMGCALCKCLQLHKVFFYSKMLYKSIVPKKVL